MKTIFLSLSFLLCTYSVQAQSPRESASPRIASSQSQSFSQEASKDALPSATNGTQQAAHEKNEMSMLTFLASDTFGVLGVFMAIAAGLLWFLFFTDVFQLMSKKNRQVI